MEATTHKYANMTEEEREEFNTGFLMDTLSVSKVNAFTRNPKAFERTYIYGEKFRKSASTVAGSAYHAALEHFFLEFRERNQVQLPELERIAFAYIDQVPANNWKVQKTTPTIEECEIKASKLATQLLSNFYAEIDLYLEEIDEVLSVELYCKNFITLNGVDIPLEWRCMQDLVFENHQGEVIIIDHKAKAAHSNEKEMKLSGGKQAITNCLSYETETGRKVDEVWFVENKYSKNKDKTKKQLQLFPFIMDKDSRALYEALLYEGVRGVVQAVSDPDYVYQINADDNLVDKAELYDHWCKTMTQEVEEFQYVPENKKPLIAKRLKKIRNSDIINVDPVLIKRFKQSAADFVQYNLSNTNMTQKEKIEHQLRTFGVIVSVEHEFSGYSTNTFLLEISKGVRIDSVYKLRKELANALDVPSVRVPSDLVVYEGKSYVCVETQKKRDRNLMWDSNELEGMKIPIGKDNFDRTLYWDLNNHSTPHIVIGGATGSGKSTCIESMLAYIELAGVNQIEIFDPKYEFTEYMSNEKFNVIQDILEIEERAAELVDIMESKIKSGDNQKIVIVFDEMENAFTMARSGRELNIYEMVPYGDPLKGKTKRELVGELKSLQQNTGMLLQKGRSSGIRIMTAMQHPSAKTLSGSLKANLPVQICFRVAKAVNSSIIIGETGGESLAGFGDGLINSPEYIGIQRFQSFWKND